MKNFIATQLRHLLTFVPGLIAFLHDWGVSDAQIAEAVSAIAAALAVIATRCILLIAEHFGLRRRFARLLDEGYSNALILTLSLGLAFGLTSCAQLGAVRGIVTISDPATGAKAGISRDSAGATNAFLRLVNKDGSIIQIDAAK